MDEFLTLKEVTEEEYEKEHKNVNTVTKSSKSESKKEPNSFRIPLSFLMSGNDLKISNTLVCKHPTIQEIFDIDKHTLGYNSEAFYLLYVNLFVADPYDYMVYLYDKGYDYENTSSFKLFLLRFEDCISKINFDLQNAISSGNNVDQIIQVFQNNIYFSAFNFFFGINEFYIDIDDGKDILVDKDNNFIMNEEIFELIHQFIKSINGFVDPKDRINPENDGVKKMLIDDMREDAEQKELMRKQGLLDEEPDEFLGKRLSAVTWLSGNITPFNRNNLHIYDITDGYNRISKINNYDNTLLGIFVRYIDPKSVNMQEIYWAN